MAKKKKGLVSKKTKKKMKRAAPWAIAVAAVGGMIATVADRKMTLKARATAADIIERVRPHKSKADGLANGYVSQQSGAV